MGMARETTSNLQGSQNARLTTAIRRAGESLRSSTPLWMVLLAGLALPASLSAADTSQRSDDPPTFVAPPQEPTEVSVALYLMGLSRVSEPSAAFPTYDVEAFLNLSWKDPRLAFGDDGSSSHVFLEEEAEEKLSEIWSPDIEIENEIEQRQTESIELTIWWSRTGCRGSATRPSPTWCSSCAISRPRPSSW